MTSQTTRFAGQIPATMTNSHTPKTSTKFDLQCSNPNSCHPWLLAFGLFTAILMLIYLIGDTFFDNVKRQSGPIFAITERPQRRVPTSEVRTPAFESRVTRGVGADERVDGNGDGDGFKALRYEEMGSVAFRGVPHVNERRSEVNIEDEKARYETERDRGDLGTRVVDIADDFSNHRETWYGGDNNVTQVEDITGEKRTNGNSVRKFQNRRASDLEYRPASFVEEGSGGGKRQGEFNPYTWPYNGR